VLRLASLFDPNPGPSSAADPADLRRHGNPITRRPAWAAAAYLRPGPL